MKRTDKATLFHVKQNLLILYEQIRKHLYVDIDLIYSVL